MTIVGAVAAALLLSIERATYVWVWHRPDRFRELVARSGFAATPVDGLHALFRIFKVIQVGVFIAWCAAPGSAGVGWFGGDLMVIAAGALLFAVGQALNASVFLRLGRVGVFYGNRLGHEVPWCREFPFTVLRHPQYVGAVLSIWGFFLAARFPHGDWLVLPLLETVYYAAGAHFEQ